MVTNEVIIDGDFNSDEVKALRDEADIIVTNPPFSLFRKFLAWIMEGQKQFLILGALGAIGYKEVFPYIQNNQVWLGANSIVSLLFEVPDDAAKYTKIIGGKKYMAAPCTWFTNIDNIARHSDIPYLTMEQHELLGHEFYTYTNFDAIDVPNAASIPIDYEGVMGVPINFMLNYNPDKFELIGVGGGDLGKSIGIGANLTDDAFLELKKKTKSHIGPSDLVYIDKDNKLIAPFTRLLIRRRFE